MAEGGDLNPGGSIEGKLDKLLQMFGSMEQRFKAVEDALGNLAKDVQAVKKGSEEQAEKIEKIEKEVKSQAEMVNEVHRQHNYRLTNLEDRQRRRNLRLRGFKQGFGVGVKLAEAVQGWLSDNGIEIDLNDIERVHWSFPRRNPERQRDIVIAFASERKAEMLYKHLKGSAGLNQDGTEIRILRDLSRESLQQRAALRPITSRLFQSGVKFTWAFPVAVLVFQGNQMYRARTLEEGKVLLQQLGIELGKLEWLEGYEERKEEQKQLQTQADGEPQMMRKSKERSN